MDRETDPTTVEETHYWIRSQRVLGYPRIARDTYFPTHDVTRPADVTEDDRPPTDDEAVRELDRQALAEHYTSGKWVVQTDSDEVMDLWQGILDDVEAETIWDAKVSTALAVSEFPYDDHVVIVYTPNYFEQHDVDRVRERLRQAHGVTDEISYKPDYYSHEGIYDDNADDFGLERAARYRA